MSSSNDSSSEESMIDPAYPDEAVAIPPDPSINYQPPPYPSQSQNPNPNQGEIQNPDPNQGKSQNQDQLNQGQPQSQGQLNQPQNPIPNQGQLNQPPNPNPLPVDHQQIIIQVPANNKPEPSAKIFGSGWESSLFGCCSNPCCFCLIMLCPICTQVAAASKATKSSCMVPWCIIKRCGCCGFALNRGSIRRAYGIRGSFCEDCCTHMFCHICAISQEYRESRKRG